MLHPAGYGYYGLLCSFVGLTAMVAGMGIMTGLVRLGAGPARGDDQPTNLQLSQRFMVALLRVRSLTVAGGGNLTSKDHRLGVWQSVRGGNHPDGDLPVKVRPWKATGGLMEIFSTKIPDVKIIKPRKHSDHRGFFSETYNQKALAEIGVKPEFVQDNHSLSIERGVVRGLHYQIPPFAQDKLVRVIRGSVFDVAVDLRRGSPTFRSYVSVILSADEWNQILIPKGFAHGLCTLHPNTEVLYKATNYYLPESERGVIWDDPELNIQWPVSSSVAILSDKDRRLPRFSDLRDLFDL